MKHEEDELLPQFMAAEGVTPEYLMQLGRLFEDAKLFAPSRCVCVLHAVALTPIGSRRVWLGTADRGSSWSSSSSC